MSKRLSGLTARFALQIVRCRCETLDDLRQQRLDCRPDEHPLRSRMLTTASEGFPSALVPHSPHLPQAGILAALVAFDTALLLFGLRQFRRKALT